MGADQPNRDHYATLGVEDGATSDEIRKAFRSLAARYHPDKNRDDKRAATRFKQINAAYQVLSDPAKRRAYDELTKPIEDYDAPVEPKTTPKQRATKAKQAPEAPRNPEPEPERELLRDNHVVVTTQRLLFAGDRSFSVKKVVGVQIVHHGRDTVNLVMGLGLVLGALVVAVADHPRLATVFGVMGGSALVRYFSRAPSYIVRLVLGGETLDAAASPNAAWTRDVVRAIEHVAQVRAVSISSSSVGAGALGGALGSVLVVAVGWGLAAQAPPAAKEPERSVSRTTYHTEEASTYAPTQQVPSTRPPSIRTRVAPVQAIEKPRAVVAAPTPSTDPCGNDMRCVCARRPDCPECVRACLENSASDEKACTRFCLSEPPHGGAPQPGSGSQIVRAAPF